MSNEEFGKELLFSLPPMESKDLNTTVLGDLKKLNAFQETFLQELSDKHCTEGAPKGSSQIEYVKGKLTDYQQSLYIDKGVTARHNVIEDGKEVVIRTYAEHLDTHNCMTGSWSAQWTVLIQGEKEADLGGSAKLHAYYFEEGSNVQMRADKTFVSKPIEAQEEMVNSLVAKFEKQKMSYEEQLAKVIVDQITAHEKEMYTQLASMVEELGDSTLKKFRRILPVTKTRFKWNAEAQKQVRLLNARKTA
jgi:uncharacterized coiled-coil protein SlyX